MCENFIWVFTEYFWLPKKFSWVFQVFPYFLTFSYFSLIFQVFPWVLWTQHDKIITVITASKQKPFHCVKSVQIRRFFWSIFSCIRNEYGDFSILCGISWFTHLTPDLLIIKISRFQKYCSVQTVPCMESESIFPPLLESWSVWNTVVQL